MGGAEHVGGSAAGLEEHVAGATAGLDKHVGGAEAGLEEHMAGATASARRPSASKLYKFRMRRVCFPMAACAGYSRKVLSSD